MLVYVAGPYRGTSRFRPVRFLQVVRNILRSRKIAMELWKRGYVAICPHMNTALMDGVCDSDRFIDGDLKILKHCDAVVLCPGFTRSAGTVGEIRFALERDIPVFEDVDALERWVDECGISSA